MKRWWILFPIVLGLAAAGYWWAVWLPPVWSFLTDQKDALGSLRSLVVVIGAVAGIVLAVRRFIRGKDEKVESAGTEERSNAVPDPAAPPSETEAPARSTSASGRGVSIVGNLDRSVVFTGDHNVYQEGVREPRSQPPAETPPAADVEAARRRYLEYLDDRYRYLDLKGIGAADRLTLRLPLGDVYVPLQARLELPPGETWDRQPVAARALLAGRRLSDEDAERLDRRPGEPRPVLDLVRSGDGLVVLGDPGSGKTTFLKFLAVTVAAGDGAALGLAGRLPVLVPLSAFANASQERQGLRLDDFVSEYVHGLGADGPVSELLAEALGEGRALLLLDGLDEVREPGLRQTVVRRVVDFFSFHRRAGNKFVMTSRIVGYRDVRTVAEGLAECTLVDFDDGEITAFVDKWTSAIERQASGETRVAEADAERERRELLAAIAGNPGVRRLAANPLLLTILALMKRQGVALPERRVELYDQYVRTLLSTWNRTRGLGRPPTRDLDVVETVRVLAPLALWMHEVDPGLGLVKRQDLVRKLEAIFESAGEADSEARARAFLADVREHAGLLLERGPGEYGFIHLTFEEYLAAAAIAFQGQGDARKITGLLLRHLGDPAWHEVALLLVGYLGLIQQLDAVAGQVVERLACEPFAEPGKQARRLRSQSPQAAGETPALPVPPGQAAVVAGQALLDVGATGVRPESRPKVIDGLVKAMQSEKVAGPLRRQAGLALGKLGWRPEDLDAFVEVPAGLFLYGDAKEERVIAERYWIGKYPVTNLQYASFVEDSGYRRRELWSEEGWRWRQKSQRQEPRERGEKWTNPIFPRVDVTFYEAEAYCRWLRETTESFEVVGADALLSARGLRVRLPSEEEWERAARGTDGRVYPWGDEFRPERANTEEGGAGGTTAVCTYPSGESPAGAWDLSGNVYEWTSTFRKYQIVCGGWFADNRDSARCAARFWRGPGFFSDFAGFRCVLSLANSES